MFINSRNAISAAILSQTRSSNASVRLCWYGALVLLILIVPTVAALLIDERSLREVNLWIKPLKFQLSLALYLITLAVLIPLLDQQRQHGRAVFITVSLALLACAFEIAWIMIQALRGRGSHFNVDTSLEATMYQLMGIGAVVLVAGSFIIGVMIWRYPASTSAAGLREGAVLGLVTGAVLTLIVAGYMSSTGSHFTTDLESDAGGMMFTGWSLVTGDFRTPHFFATHAMQFLPAAGWFLDRYAKDVARDSVRFLSILYSLLVAGLFLLALSGRPLIPV